MGYSVIRLSRQHRLHKKAEKLMRFLEKEDIVLEVCNHALTIESGGTGVKYTLSDLDDIEGITYLPYECDFKLIRDPDQ